MHVSGRASQRHMKGNQVPITVYLPPKKYWLLKAASSRAGLSMQHLLRAAIDQVLLRTLPGSQRRRERSAPGANSSHR